ncbi:helix-turn-helix transcriptional regulator [Nodosilinea sp. LEGE 07088]|uniref:helix-turn-helix domain-containing protein n=1 Tax=Nodosilinea sp. LEGE 07088 TaxID=2777968 RepID=UPI00187EAC8F|nr:AraC family transcriptional regulator [Nodosilinea sp. LEGE 07088]MBE9138842.1 helix-turn-helix transcriptional regulator [Nodosilinea sp. LEGE 07088]
MNTLAHDLKTYPTTSWDKIFSCLITAGQLRTRLLELVQESVKDINSNSDSEFQPQVLKEELLRLCADYQQTLTQTFQVFTSEVRRTESIELEDYLSNLTALLEEQTASARQYAAEIQMLTGVARHCLNDLSHYGLDFQQEPQLEPVFSYIEANYNSGIGLREVAQALGYSTAYLTDFVRRKTGRPVNQWIVSRRLIEACHLLSKTHQPIEQISFRIGYQNVSHFFRQFKQHHNMTPQEWRNNNLAPNSPNLGGL